MNSSQIESKAIGGVSDEVNITPYTGSVFEKEYCRMVTLGTFFNMQNLIVTRHWAEVIKANIENYSVQSRKHVEQNDFIVKHVLYPLVDDGYITMSYGILRVSLKN